MPKTTVTRDAQAALTAAVYDEMLDYNEHAYSFWRDDKGALFELRYASRAARDAGELEVTAVDDAGHPLNTDT